MASNKKELVALVTIIKEWIDLIKLTTHEVMLSIASITASELHDKVFICDSAVLKRDDGPVRIKNYVERNIPGYSDMEFKQHFRMPRKAYEKLLEKVKIKLADNNQNPRNVERDLLSTIWTQATPDSFRSIGERFDLAKSSLSHGLFRIVDILNVISRDVIKWPTPIQMQIIEKHFENKYYIKNVIGVIDGTYIKIDAPKEWPEQYINRKRYHFITLQAVCDHTLKFTDCFVGYPSSVHDCRIFRNSDLYNEVIQNMDEHFPEGRYLLGYKAYPQMVWCLVPYKNNGRLTTVETNFNKYHSKGRQCIERAFALLFGRFRRLKHLSMKSEKYIPRVVLAACVLHNICLDFSEDLSYIDIDDTHTGDDRRFYSISNSGENSTQALQLRNQISEILMHTSAPEN